MYKIKNIKIQKKYKKWGLTNFLNFPTIKFSYKILKQILNQLNRINYLSYLIIVIINVYILVTYVYVFFIYKDKPFISLFLFTLNKPLM